MSSDTTGAQPQEQQPDVIRETTEIQLVTIQDKQTEQHEESPETLRDLLFKAREENEMQRHLMEAHLLQFGKDRYAWAAREKELVNAKMDSEKPLSESTTEESNKEQKQKMDKLELDLKSSNEELKNVKEQLEKAQARINTFESTSRTPGVTNAGSKQAKGQNDKNQQQPGNSLDEEGLRRENGKLRTALTTAVARLKDKTIQAASFERQNEQLKAQVLSLKEVNGITKDLLNIRNTEVEHLRTEMDAIEDKVRTEREQRSLALARVEKATRLNADLKREYEIQFHAFKTLKSKYEEKVKLLTTENQRLVAEANAEGRPGVELNVGPLITDDEEAPQH